MKKGYVLPIAERYKDFLAEAAVMAEAEDIVKHGSRDGRSAEERLSDALKGLVVQYCVAELVQAEGYKIELNHDASNFWYDFKIGHVFVDVKSRWVGRYWSQSPAEHRAIQEKNVRVLYLCIDAMPRDGSFVYRGACWSNDMAPSQFGGQYAVNDHFVAPDLATILTINQCDGCRVAAPLNDWRHHVYPDGSLIACTKDRYY